MIRIQNVHKSFGGKDVLKGVSLTIPTGTVTAILGPSGSGKTTFLRTLNFLGKADAGTMTLGNTTVDLHKASSKEILAIRRRTAMVFQTYNLFSNMTAVENVMEGLVSVKKVKKAKAREKAEKLLQEVGMAGYENYFPAQLSGGQQQRASIARALAGDPAVILADEPTGALDSHTGREVLTMLQQLHAAGNTVVLITHDNSIAVQAQRIIRLEDGHVIYDGDAGAPEAVVTPNLAGRGMAG